jgi:hypothetical protein
MISPYSLRIILSTMLKAEAQALHRSRLATDSLIACNIRKRDAQKQYQDILRARQEVEAEIANQTKPERIHA